MRFAELHCGRMHLEKMHHAEVSMTPNTNHSAAPSISGLINGGKAAKNLSPGKILKENNQVAT
jgi:hypothetical protein